MRLSTLVATAWAAAFGLSLFGCKPEPKPPAAPPPPKVVVAPVAARPVELIAEAVGEIDGYVNAEIRARVRGYLRGQSYRDGAQVKSGQVLFTIDPVEFQAALESARGTLARAHAAVEVSKAQLARSQALLKSGTVTQRALEDATAAHADAVGQERAAQAAVRQAELNLSYTTVKSPIDGTAGLALVRVGNLVGADGPTLLTTVSQIDPVRVRFPISERDYLANAQRWRELSGHDLKWAREQFEKLKQPAAENDSLELVLADGKTYQARGVVVATDREVDPSTGTISVEALFPNPEGLLRPGLYARVRMRRQNSGESSLVVAQRALLEVQGTYSLAIVGEGNKVELRRVEVGPVTGEERVITKGVAAGERVVVEGVQKVSDGAVVVPSNAPEGSVKAAQLGR
jgi:membrane fusion protein, multidrug efflux system